MLNSISATRISTGLVNFLFNRFAVFKTRVKESVRVIAYIISNTTGMHSFEKSETCYLVQVISSLIDDASHFFVFETVRAKQLFEIVLAEGLEWASMEFVLARCRLVKDLVTAPRLVVLLLALFTKHVANVISVALLKLVHVHLFSEFLLPKGVSLIHCQSETFNE